MANNLTIVTPKDVMVNVTLPNGKVDAKLEWHPEFGKKYTNNFMRAQQYVDSEVVRFCSARVPFDTGMLQKSGMFGTVIGSGEVRYTVPYSAVQYYATAPSRRYDPNRGGMWFERGKAMERTRILQGAMKIAGGG